MLSEGIRCPRSAPRTARVGSSSPTSKTRTPTGHHRWPASANRAGANRASGCASRYPECPRDRVDCKYREPRGNRARPVRSSSRRTPGPAGTAMPRWVGEHPDSGRGMRGCQPVSTACSACASRPHVLLRVTQRPLPSPPVHLHGAVQRGPGRPRVRSHGLRASLHRLPGPREPRCPEISPTPPARVPATHTRVQRGHFGDAFFWAASVPITSPSPPPSTPCASGTAPARVQCCSWHGVSVGSRNARGAH